MKKTGDDFSQLTQIMNRLRGPQGCPWDLQQSMADIKSYLIDEAYEVLQAVDSGDRKLLCEELGDLLFLIIFMAHLAWEEGAFDMDDVIRGIERKMIRRHPHVFGDARVSEASTVRDRWETIKVQEGKQPRTSVLSGIPTTFPALYRAYCLGVRAARVGFDWKSRADVLAKVHEELRELEEALKKEDVQAAGVELGDLLFVVGNLARHLDREPEGLLRRANEKFVRRFHALETMLKEQGRSPEEVSLEEMDRLWEAAKAGEGPDDRGPSRNEPPRPNGLPKP